MTDMKKAIVGILYLFILGCAEDNREYKEYFNETHNLIKVNGYIDKNGLETGQWVYFDSLQNPIELGKQKNGLKLGTWSYVEGKSKYNINWTCINDSSSGATINIPANFVRVKNKDFLFIGTNNDTTNTINVVIQRKKLSAKLNLSSFKDTAINDVKNNYSVKGYSCQLEKFSSGKIHYYLKFSLNEKGKSYFISNVIGTLNKEEFIDISCYYSGNKSDEGYSIFSGVMTHLYINGVRFIDPFDKYLSIENCL
jgi:hypothetical protein